MSPRYAHSPDVAWVDAGSRVTILRLDRPDAEPLALEETAADVWVALTEPRTEDEVVAEMADAFSAAADDVRPGVAQLLAQSLALGIVVPVEGSGA